MIIRIFVQLSFYVRNSWVGGRTLSSMLKNVCMQHKPVATAEVITHDQYLMYSKLTIADRFSFNHTK
jgi:hypothetical protein